MSRFILTAQNTLVNLDDVTKIDGNMITIRDLGDAPITTPTAFRINELVGEYHPNTQTGLFVLQEHESRPGHYLKLRIVGWIRCPDGRMVPMLPAGRWPQFSTLDSDDFAILDEQASVVYMNRGGEETVVTREEWEEHSGLRPL